MNVRVDVTWQNEFTFAVDPFRTSGHGHFFARAGSGNAIPVDNHHAVFENLRGPRINQCASDKRDSFSVRETREDREDERERSS